MIFDNSQKGAGPRDAETEGRRGPRGIEHSQSNPRERRRGVGGERTVASEDGVASGEWQENRGQWHENSGQ